MTLPSCIRTHPKPFLVASQNTSNGFLYLVALEQELWLAISVRCEKLPLTLLSKRTYDPSIENSSFVWQSSRNLV
jgi:hypothetical protein